MTFIYIYIYTSQQRSDGEGGIPDGFLFLVFTVWFPPASFFFTSSKVEIYNELMCRAEGEIGHERGQSSKR